MFSIAQSISLLLVAVTMWFRLKIEKNVANRDLYIRRFAIALAVLQFVLLGALITTAESVRSLMFELFFFLGFCALAYSLLLKKQARER